MARASMNDAKVLFSTVVANGLGVAMFGRHPTSAEATGGELGQTALPSGLDGVDQFLVRYVGVDSLHVRHA